MGASADKEDKKYDVLVVGGGPIGTETALICSMLGKSVAVVDPRGALLGAPTGWVSKALRQLGRDHGAADGSAKVAWSEAERALGTTASRALAATSHRFEEAAAFLGDRWNPPKVLSGRARFVGSHLAAIDAAPDGGDPSRLAFDTAFIAVGSASRRIDSLPWESGESQKWLYDGDSIMNIGRVPSRLLIQGGGTIGVEYAFIFRSLGSEVSIAFREQAVMQEASLDEEVREAIMARMRRLGIELLPGTGTLNDLRPPEAGGRLGQVVLGEGASSHRLEFDAILSATGRVGCCAPLDIENTGCMAPVQGRAPVDPDSMRCLDASGKPVGNIFAVGDAEAGSKLVPEGLLSTGLAGAYIATHAAFPGEFESVAGIDCHNFDAFCPVAIWVEPTIGYVGLSTDAARVAFGDEKVGHVTVPFSETIKGCVARTHRYGDDEFYKIVYHKDDGRVLGVHIYGSNASEFIHYASAIVNSSASVFEVIRTVPPAVTLQEALKKACMRAALEISACKR